MIQDEQIKARLMDLIETEGRHSAAWNKVLDHAKNYGRMKATGKFLNKEGFIVSVDLSDKQRYLDALMLEIRYAIDDAIAENLC